MTGTFTVTWVSGFKYTGKVINSQLNGWGTMSYPDSPNADEGQQSISSIEGFWTDGQLEKCEKVVFGNGFWTATNYDHTTGKLEGDGKLIKLNKNAIEGVREDAIKGVWVEGVLKDESVTVTQNEEVRYTGGYENNLRE